MPANRLTEDELDELREVFSHFDTDGNGTIEIAELGRLLEALDAKQGQEELEAGMKALDADNNGRIDFDEFVAWWGDR